MSNDVREITAVIITKLMSRKLWVGIGAFAALMAEGKTVEAVMVVVAYLLGQGIADHRS